MTRQEIVKRINQKMYEGMHTFEDIKYELDDAIIVINNTMHTTFPLMSDILVTEDSKYTYIPEEETEAVPFFPEQYIRNVVIEYAVSALFRREAEFGHEYNVAVGAYERGLSAMFRDFYDNVPDQFVDELTGIIPVNPFEVTPDE